MVALKRGVAAKAELVSNVSLFFDCSKKELAQIAARCDEVRLPSGELVMAEGDPGNRFFVLAEGSAEVTIGGQKVGSIRPGQFFGEMALLDQGPRSATVTTALPSRLIVLDARGFKSLVMEHPSVAIKMLRTLAQRLRAVEKAAPTH